MVIFNHLSLSSQAHPSKHYGCSFSFFLSFLPHAFLPPPSSFLPPSSPSLPFLPPSLPSLPSSSLPPSPPSLPLPLSSPLPSSHPPTQSNSLSEASNQLVPISHSMHTISSCLEDQPIRLTQDLVRPNQLATSQ